MGLPDINILFKSTASTAVQRSERGIVALILKDTVENGFHALTDITDIPATLSDSNKEQIQLAMKGGVTVPKKVVVYVLPSAALDYTEALDYLETVKFDYLAIPGVQTGEITTIVTYIKQLRDNKDIKGKVVLPHADSADHEGIINFATDDIEVGETTYTAAQYCARIAGLIAGTPLTQSVTYAVLPEVDDVPHLTKDEFDTAIDAGKLILMNDGEKVKIARGVNSLVTVTADKGAEFKKILIVEKNDMWHYDVKKVINDYYVGKYPNTYVNKLVLITSIQSYNDQLALEGLLDSSLPEYNRVGINLSAQKIYLTSIGTDLTDMKDQQIKESNTGDKVFIATNLKWADAMEDFDIAVSL